MPNYLAFDKLSHGRMIVLAKVYFQTHAGSATRIRELEQEAARIPPAARTRFHGLVGNAPVMQRLYERIQAVAHRRDGADGG